MSMRQDYLVSLADRVRDALNAEVTAEELLEFVRIILGVKVEPSSFPDGKQPYVAFHGLIGRKIPVIKALRDAVGWLGLKEAKEMCEGKPMSLSREEAEAASAGVYHAAGGLIPFGQMSTGVDAILASYAAHMTELQAAADDARASRSQAIAELSVAKISLEAAQKELEDMRKELQDLKDAQSKKRGK